MVKTQKLFKRAFDVTAASIGLVALTPLFAACAVAIKFDSTGPILFRQRRVGRGFRHFTILKFRTMVSRDHSDHSLTIGEDSRITRVGRFLRKSKIDELPQLVNVLRGDMSLVGPRPEVPRYVEMFRDQYKEILTVRPGITDLGSMKYCDEAHLLSLAEDPEETYVQEVLPDKMALAKEYITKSSLMVDLSLVINTLLAICSRKSN